MSHLDAETIDAILDGTLRPDTARALGGHLRSACPTCEAACADGPDVDALARLLDAELAAPVAPTAREQEAIWRGVAAHTSRARPANRRWWAAAALALAAGAALVLGRPGVETPKGASGTPDVHLRVLAMRAEQGGYEPEGRLADGATVGSDRTLLFEIETSGPATRYLWAVDAQGRVVPLVPAAGGTAASEPGGRRRPTVDGHDLALDLADLAGPLRLFAAAAADPLDASDRAVLERQGDLAGVSYDVVDLVVEP
jgi:hypothetical protein